MFLTEIKIFNFKCFSHKCLKEKVSGGINIFLGINGSGKTTFLKALEILFSERKKICDSSTDRSELWFNETCENNFSVIQASFDNQDCFFPIPFGKIKIKKFFNSKVTKMVINNFLFSEKRFINFIYSSKIGSETIYYLVKQGSHDFFKFLNPNQRLNLFKKKIGITCYEKSKKKSLYLLEKSEILKKKILFLIFQLLKKTRKRTKQIKKEKKKIIKKKIILLKKICIEDEKFFLKNKTINYQNYEIFEIKKYLFEKIRIFFFFFKFSFIQNNQKDFQFKKR